jgi:glycosyltransferase involved in cell wall biosynthesis
VTRVCLVGPSLDILGGQAIALQRLLARLREIPTLEVEFLPVNPRLPGPLRSLQRMKYVRTAVTSALYLATLLRCVGRYDVIHAFSASYVSFLLAPLPAMIIGRLYGKKVVLNYRSGEAEDHLTRCRRTALPAMRLAHTIVVPSGYLVEVFARFHLPARAITNFVDPAKLPYRERDSVEPVFLSNRNFEPLYNVGCVLRAFARIQRELPHARLIVAGDGSQRAQLRDLAVTLGLQHVEFVGQVSPDLMGELYGRADVYLNAPDIDNMPNSIIEAFAAGLPVVTTNAGGIPFVVTHGETGLVVERNDAQGLASAALRLVREPVLARRLAAQAHAECVARYVWSAVRDEWEQLYRSLAGTDTCECVTPPAGLIDSRSVGRMAEPRAVER